MLGQVLGLLFEKKVESAFRQALRGGGGDLFHGPESDVQTGAGVAESPSGNDFGPLSGELAKLLKFLGREVFCRHG